VGGGDIVLHVAANRTLSGRRYRALDITARRMLLMRVE
jgi:hypothetical protein